MKTIVVFTKENNKYFAFIAGINLFTTGWNTLEECRNDVAEELGSLGETLCNQAIASDLREYFSTGDDDNNINNIVSIDVLEVKGEQ